MGYSEVEKTIAAAGNYAANDVVSESAAVGTVWTFASMAPSPYNVGEGWLVKAEISSNNPALVGRYRLYLFDEEPATSNLNDNVAHNITEVDRDKLLGYLTFPAIADEGDISFAEDDGIRKKYQCKAPDTNLYGVLVTLDAETTEVASQKIKVKLWSE